MQSRFVTILMVDRCVFREYSIPCVNRGCDLSRSIFSLLESLLLILARNRVPESSCPAVFIAFIAFVISTGYHEQTENSQQEIPQRRQHSRA